MISYHVPCLYRMKKWTSSPNRQTFETMVCSMVVRSLDFNAWIHSSHPGRGRQVDGLGRDQWRHRWRRDLWDEGQGAAVSDQGRRSTCADRSAAVPVRFGSGEISCIPPIA